MTLPPQALIDIDKFTPQVPANVLPKPVHRLELAFESALNKRQPDAAVAKLVSGVDQSVLRQAGDNLRMRMLIALRPPTPGAPVAPAAQYARMKLYAGLKVDLAAANIHTRLGQRIARRFFEALSGADLKAEWANRNEDQRLDIVVGLMHAFGHESGFAPPSRIETDEIPPDENGRIQTGEYRPLDDVLWQNTHAAASWDDPVEALAIAGHEATHKLQQAMGMRLMAEFRPDLVGELPAIGRELENDAERRAAWYFIDNIMFGHITTESQEIGYLHQPIESHARMLENAIRQTLNRHLVLGLDQELITGVTADDLAELGLDMNDIRADSKPGKFGLN
ncbi:MAG: hypothetical protein KI792_00150 [Alphaproteobacteria bacterium]|nr:hypothetical protein [Alphaproteobacteria bacterium SS10]